MNFHNQQQELAMLQTMTKPEMTTSSMWITPKIATELLGGNINNRRLRLRYVRDLAAMMRRGDWLFTHQGIAFAPDGHLLDGQHRLQAVIMANIPIRMNVSRDCDPATFIALDAGMRRQVSDHLHLPTNTVAALRFMALLAEGNSQPAQTTTTQIRDAVEWAKDLIDTVELAGPSKRAAATSAPCLAGAALQYAISKDQPALLAAWRAYTLQDYARMPASVQSLERRITKGIKVRGNWKTLLILSFRAFDSSRQTATGTMLIKDEDASVAELSKIAAGVRARILAA